VIYMIHDRNIDNNAAIQPHKVMGAGFLMRRNAKTIYVDGTNGSDNNSGTSPRRAKATIQAGVTAAGAQGVCYVFPKTITDFTGDPASYAETVIIPATHMGMRLVGVGNGITQGGLPQLRKGSGSTALLTVRAAGCLITGMGFNGAGATGGGILLDDDYAAKTEFGTVIMGNHFKNCKGHATDGRVAGAVTWTAAGNAWQVRIEGNRFYKNLADVVLKGTSNTVPQDVIIQNNVFSGPAADVDVNLYLAGGSGMNGVLIDNNIFQQLPAKGSGSVARYIDATGCVGMMTRCFFGCMTSEGSTELTFEAAGTGAKIPTTLHMAGNFGQFETGVGAGLVSGEIYA